MRLFLAVAVLMLAFIAYTEAQEETAEQKLAKFGKQMTEMGKNLAEKAKNTFENINNSEFAVTSRNWFTEQLEKLKTRVQEISQ
ncbi:apolipoprotein C-I isoform X3 [Acanthopagrus latus]|uniref:apolipoprotein C-I isoform X3 n=1 Tax=Acanthopagrus latus TaxID=8177 RepID=UPI00187CBDD5|nr:apolipoprotein C-I isoform X3 [Acanthopagrus latus]